jgi:MFS family permease
MNWLREHVQRTFASLRNPNYRRYFTGQSISLIGTWMQSVAQSWLVLQLTGSATALGIVVALQTLPVLLLGSYGGLVADRMDKRRLMIVLQTIMGGLALVLAVLTLTHQVTLWQVYVLASCLGLCNCFENPARQAFVLEMVGPADLRNAVTLNSVLQNGARAVGPAVAGVIIAVGGIGICFLINAASFVAVVVSLVRLDVSRLAPSVPAPRRPGQLREGFRYVRDHPKIGVPLLMMALVGCLTYEFQVTLPVVAKQSMGGGSQTYGFMTAAMGVGAVLGGLYTASRSNSSRIGPRALAISCALFGLVMLGAAVAPNLAVELVALAFVGAASVSFLSKGNSTLQLETAAHMRGRVMALWAIAFLGSTPIGGPVAGWVAQHLGARAGLLLGALACLVACAAGLLLLRAYRAHQPHRLPAAGTRCASHTWDARRIGPTMCDAHAGYATRRG